MTVRKPLILLEDGYNRWRILGPGYNFGQDIGLGGVKHGDDRRYEELAVVNGDMFAATERLHQLEAGRGQEGMAADDDG